MPQLNNITKKWGNRSIFEDFSLEFKENKTTVILGKSGIGKTTLLSIIANLTDYLGSTDGFDKISYVFQEPRLIPFLTVYENLKYALGEVYGKEELEKVVDNYLNLTGMIDLKHKVAKTLSGGEMQRVSLIRAFSYPSKTLLCDEPFSSLDLGIKLKIIDLFSDLLKFSPKTSILVTHSIDEALYLADEIVFLKENDYIKFVVDTKKEDRKYGYEEDNTIRKELYNLFSLYTN